MRSPSPIHRPTCVLIPNVVPAPLVRQTPAAALPAATARLEAIRQVSIGPSGAAVRAEDKALPCNIQLYALNRVVLLSPRLPRGGGIPSASRLQVAAAAASCGMRRFIPPRRGRPLQDVLGRRQDRSLFLPVEDVPCRTEGRPARG
jgi:hypothetical protein